MNQITFTQYKSPDSLSKRYWLEDGLIQKQAAAQMTKGTANRVTIPFADFGQVLAKQTDKQAFGYGVHALSYPDKVTISTKAKASPDKNIISRSLEYFQYNGAGVVMIDHDPSEYGQTFTPDELLAVLTAIHPEIAQAARIVRGSVSAGIHIEGEVPRTDKGFHLYMPVVDATLLNQYGALLTDRLWLQEHGFIALAANGALLERTCIDAAVFSPERLDFVGRPIITGAGLEFTAPEIIYTEGEALDIATLPALTSEEVAQLAILKAEAKEAIKPSAAKKNGNWKEDKISAMIAAGAAPEKAVEVINQILRGGCRDLYADFILEFSGGTVTVGAVLANPKAFDGKALADPIEGSAYGRTTAKFFANDGKPVINSLAHGQKLQYFLHHNPVETNLTSPAISRDKPDWKLALAAHIEEWNRSHASTLIGGKHRIMRIEPSSSTHDGRESFTFFNRDELSRVYDNSLIKTGEKEIKGEVIDLYKNELMAWALDRRSRSFTGGVIFLPAKKAPDNYFNTWRGLSVQPQRNDGLLERIHYHMKEVVCAGHQDLYGYMLKWIAYTIQNPDKPAGAALVLRGEKGSGKGTIGHFLGNIWGNHGLHISQAKHLVGNFNGHLNDVCFLFADEAFFSGDKQHEGVLKALVTEPNMIIERKGIDAISQPNYLKIFMSTNSSFAVPASRDERRYCVIDVSSSHIDDRDYFKALHADCKSKEVQSAFLHQMQSIDLTGWHTGMIPDSVGLREQRYHSMDSVQKWVVNAL
ncbi:MAG TPA: primase-helicase family protein, partial [Methylobacter sp.]